MTRTDTAGIEAAQEMAALSPETQLGLEAVLSQGYSGSEQITEAFRAIGSAVGSKRSPVSGANKKRLFAFAEQLLRQGEPQIANAVATCFLETLWRAARNGGFDFGDVDQQLGSETRKYLLAWDEFNKTETEGLRRR